LLNSSATRSRKDVEPRYPEHGHLARGHAGSVSASFPAKHRGAHALAFHFCPRVVARRIPFDDPTTLSAVRIGYVVSQVVIIGTYFFVAQKVRQSSCPTVSSADTPVRSRRRMTRPCSSMWTRRILWCVILVVMRAHGQTADVPVDPGAGSTGHDDRPGLRSHTGVDSSPRRVLRCRDDGRHAPLLQVSSISPRSFCPLYAYLSYFTHSRSTAISHPSNCSQNRDLTTFA
jgi:hypothetical protein